MNTTLEKLIASSLVYETARAPRDKVLDWAESQRDKACMKVDRVPLKRLRQWQFDSGGNLVHASGEFFSIQGVRAVTNRGLVARWSQPIIHQPEIGILGFLCQNDSEGFLHFLVQAKMEPGNKGIVQLSPTLQTTRSNYTRVHGGSTPPYLDMFRDPTKARPLVDQLQSEQGARFYKKRNRNMIIELDPDEVVPVEENYCWMTLGQLKQLIRRDDLINMDSRTVLSCTPAVEPQAEFRLSDYSVEDPFCQAILEDLCRGSAAYHSINDILCWLSRLKVDTELDVTLCDLSDVENWVVSEDRIYHEDESYFEVIGVRVECAQREVLSWDQPLIRQQESGIIGMIVKRIDGVYHLLVQAKMELGNFDILELAPTVQCITGSYTNPQYDVRYLNLFLEEQGLVRYKATQSEEGGRFYRESNLNMVIEVDDDFPLAVDPGFIWMSFRQAKEFIRFNNYFNVEARSILACICPI